MIRFSSQHSYFGRSTQDGFQWLKGSMVASAGAAILQNEVGATCCEWEMSKTEGARVPGDYELAYQPCTTYPDFQMREREISSLVEPTIIWVCNDRLTNILNSYACL